MPIPEFEIPAEPRPEPKFARAKSNQGVCLEVFSGRAGLTLALKEAGLKCLTDMELKKGKQHNLLRKSTQRVVFRLLASRQVDYVHFGTVLSSLLKSTAQSGELEES